MYRVQISGNHTKPDKEVGLHYQIIAASDFTMRPRFAGASHCESTFWSAGLPGGRRSDAAAGRNSRGRVRRRCHGEPSA
ncbi:MAG: hypothetical protein WKF77_08725 [Planctomycetaceae bacterium]